MSVEVQIDSESERERSREIENEEMVNKLRIENEEMINKLRGIIANQAAMIAEQRSEIVTLEDSTQQGELPH